MHPQFRFILPSVTLQPQINSTKLTFPCASLPSETQGSLTRWHLPLVISRPILFNSLRQQYRSLINIYTHLLRVYTSPLHTKPTTLPTTNLSRPKDLLSIVTVPHQPANLDTPSTFFNSKPHHLLRHRPLQQAYPLDIWVAYPTQPHGDLSLRSKTIKPFYYSIGPVGLQFITLKYQF